MVRAARPIERHGRARELGQGESAAADASGRRDRLPPERAGEGAGSPHPRVAVSQPQSDLSGWTFRFAYQTLGGSSVNVTPYIVCVAS